MNKRAKIFLALAALCGLATASVARGMLESREEPITTRNVLVASERLPAGNEVNAAATQIVAWPSALAPQGALSSVSDLSGRVLARTVEPGEPLLEAALLPEGRKAGLDALIGEARRAVSVEVDEFAGVAGFLQPGSLVDVLSTSSHRVGSGEATRSVKQTRTVLTGLRVLAVDERVVRNEGAPDEEIKVVTLEVGGEEAAALAHADHEGDIKLALRSQGDEAETSRPVKMVVGTSVHEVRF